MSYGPHQLWVSRWLAGLLLLVWLPLRLGRTPDSGYVDANEIYAKRKTMEAIPNKQTAHQKHSKRITLSAIIALLEDYSDFLTHVRQGDAISLTETAAFLRSGLLHAWCELTPVQRHRVLGQLQRKICKTAARQSYAISRQMVVICEWRMFRDELFCGALVLESLRHLLSNHSEVAAVQWLNNRMKQGVQFSFGPIPFRTILHLSSKTRTMFHPHFLGSVP